MQYQIKRLCIACYHVIVFIECVFQEKVYSKYKVSRV